MIAVETYASADQAATALHGDAVFLGGGTLIMRAVNYGDLKTERIVRSTDPAMKSISTSGERISIGAAATMSDVMLNPQLAFLAPVARSIGGPAVRNMATVGGNLFASHPYGDFAVALLALDGRVSVAGSGEEDLGAFLARRSSFSGVVTEVSIARPATGDFRYRKVSRIKPKGVSVMSLAAWLPRSGGRLSGARVAFGAMGNTPVRANGVERALEGANLDVSGIAEALRAVRTDLQPPDDPIASSWYRSEVAPVHLRRLLLDEEVS
ncbi:xanthine dehydrogenase family protein subunit M [Ahrensia sp. R2A130]|uniref:FAD binding domain-containing protein n=1 Tax=Ahrensia sp. R2A130 TaxID=744979 RepID=UPI0001E0C388|nr:FAD binding domain-containing protein [Ahrensia sp. R2A130]EFL87827.1 oxidoreductase [Ahrensia sp. R2A130]